MLPLILVIVTLEEFLVITTFHSNIAIEETVFSIIITTSYICIVNKKRCLTNTSCSVVAVARWL